MVRRLHSIKKRTWVEQSLGWKHNGLCCARMWKVGFPEATAVGTAHTISSYSGMAAWPGLNLSDTAGGEDAMNHGCHPDFRPVPR